MLALLALLRIALLSSLHDLFQFWKSKRHGYAQSLDVNKKAAAAKENILKKV
jgi:hypothetical protein